MARKSGPVDGPITIKKYANRRLYNTATSSYVTLDDLCQMVKEDQDFVVYDAKTGEDITRSVLTQIIVEEEAKGANLLPISFLRNLISLYGDSLQALVPRYLEESMASFAKNQAEMRDYLQNTFDGLFPRSIEDMGKQNLAMMEQAMKMFAPPGSEGAQGQQTEQPKDDEERLEQLKRQVDELKAQLDAISGDKK